MRTRETYFSAPITRCVMCRKRQLQALFWLGVEAALLFCVAFLLACWLVSLLMPVTMELIKPTMQEVRP